MSGRRKVEGRGLVDIAAIADVLGNIREDLMYYRSIDAAPDTELLLAVSNLQRDVVRWHKELKK